MTLIILAVWAPTLVHPVKDDATHEMLRQIASETDPVVIEEATAALENIRSGVVTNVSPAVPPLPAELAEHPAVLLRGLTAAEIQAQPQAVIDQLGAAETVVREEAVAAVVRGGLTEAVGPLLPLLGDEDESLRQAAGRALARLAPEVNNRQVIPAVVNSLDREHSLRACQTTTQVLVALHDQAAWNALLKLLKHEHALVRLAAVQAVTDWNDPDRAAVLEPILADVDEPVARAAAIGLGTLGNPTSTASLRGRLADPAPAAVQEKIAWALGELHDLQAVFPLADLVGQEPDFVSAAAAEALGKIGDPLAIATLQKPVKKIVPAMVATRRESIKALRLLGDHDNLRGVWKVVTQKIIPTPMGPVHDSTDVREEGLRYLAAAGEPRLAGSLMELLRSDEPEGLQAVLAETFRTIAVYATDDTAEELLQSLVTTPPAEVRPVLVEVLQQLTGEEYQALPDESYLRYSVESLGPPSSITIPPPPGVERVD